jgi:group II intron reverse transcriptase/maturase
MAQQKSEDLIVPEGRRKPSPTPSVKSREEGGKGIPVEERLLAQRLLFATAESPRVERGSHPVKAQDQSGARTAQEPMAESKRVNEGVAMLEEVVERLDEALDKVAANQGAPGPDRQTIAEVRKHWSQIRPKVATALVRGRYQPGEIRRAWIEKPGGGRRGLGIPNVVDRVVQEAVRAVLEPIFEPTFHPSSHGFRPNRSCHTAITEAAGYVEEGYTWVVDIDLEKFFDRVHHQRLLARLACRVEDKGLLALIGRMLRAKVILPDGVRVSTDEGVPQGGPLSPLLSNVVLDELDRELYRRGLRFVRYADDCNIYVRSPRAGERVMASVTRFIERRLRLKVNATKSAVARPDTRHFLGFSLRPRAGGPPEILLSERSQLRLRERIRELTPRSAGVSLTRVIQRVNQYFEGWDGFFRICTDGVERVLGSTDAHVRRRLRAIILKHWRRPRTIARNLIRLGVPRSTAWRRIYEGRKSLWTLSHDPAVDRGLRNAYFADRGLVSLLARARDRWTDSNALQQLTLPWDIPRS